MALLREFLSKMPLYAVKRLELKLLPGLNGQMTGSRSIGFKNLQPRMFTVNFYELAGSRSLFGEGQSSGENVQLPIASSWYISFQSFEQFIAFLRFSNLSLTMSVYRTLKEICDAIELAATDADDFVFK